MTEPRRSEANDRAERERIVSGMKRAASTRSLDPGTRETWHLIADFILTDRAAHLRDAGARVAALRDDLAAWFSHDYGELPEADEPEGARRTRKLLADTAAAAAARDARIRREALEEAADDPFRVLVAWDGEDGITAPECEAFAIRMLQEARERISALAQAVPTERGSENDAASGITDASGRTRAATLPRNPAPPTGELYNFQDTHAPKGATALLEHYYRVTMAAVRAIKREYSSAVCHSVVDRCAETLDTAWATAGRSLAGAESPPPASGGAAEEGCAVKPSSVLSRTGPVVTGGAPPSTAVAAGRLEAFKLSAQACLEFADVVAVTPKVTAFDALVGAAHKINMLAEPDKRALAAPTRADDAPPVPYDRARATQSMLEKLTEHERRAFNEAVFEARLVGRNEVGYAASPPIPPSEPRARMTPSEASVAMWLGCAQTGSMVGFDVCAVVERLAIALTEARAALAARSGEADGTVTRLREALREAKYSLCDAANTLHRVYGSSRIESDLRHAETQAANGLTATEPAAVRPTLVADEGAK